MDNEKGHNRPGHDGLFKFFLREPDTARDFLAVHLPADIRAQVRLDTLKLEPGSFVDQTLRELHSDVLYSVETEEGHAGYIYCLLEHQSTADRMMAWRMMRYSMAVMDAHLKKGNDTLPVVVPLLFYQGTVRPYPYSTDWMDCFDAPALAREVYSRPWPLVDVSVMEDSDLQSHRRMALLELVQRDIRRRDAASLLRDVVKLIRIAGNTREQVEAVLCYIIYNGMTNGSGTPFSYEPFLYELAGEIPEYKELIMGTIAQQLKEEGIQQGIQQGLQQGLQQGIEQGIQQGIEQERLAAQQKLLETAWALLDNGVSLDVVIKSTGLSRETLEQPRH
ncbi:Rpn family recombination-promoting nuclease/putative transposase [Salmonella enterica subsp. enterica]|nr:Rpn family recombination-promoting nuclease/putative transposase [Salmonella enterica subsp. enterica]EDR4259505.1 Rpn family recombination-promoting nuclease/putative transposase [Salmonella enterica subsp. enterica]EDX0929908.1 Rpn family recombination-promoting nuclease/putative transposase [Salmonella enterica subsp. enterica]ELS5584573.1 Rpn family recombination-promoting nuclease/putative transposase [Salmonella enterica]